MSPELFSSNSMNWPAYGVECTYAHILIKVHNYMHTTSEQQMCELYRDLFVWYIPYSGKFHVTNFLRISQLA